MIDVAAYIDAANICDANGWKVGGVIYSTGGKWANLKSILQAGGSEPCSLGGLLSCTVNAPRVSLATITRADIVGEASVTAMMGRRNRINGIIPKYRSEDHGWEEVPGAPVRVSAYVTADSGPRTREVAYPLVQNVAQASQLALYDICNSREFQPISTPLKLRWIGYKRGLPDDRLRRAGPVEPEDHPAVANARSVNRQRPAYEPIGDGQQARLLPRRDRHRACNASLQVIDLSSVASPAPRHGPLRA